MHQYTYKLKKAIDENCFKPNYDYKRQGDFITIESDKKRSEITKQLLDSKVIIEPKTITLDVEADCIGCLNKVEFMLKKHPLIEDASFDFERKKLTVSGYMSEEEIKHEVVKVDKNISFHSKKKRMRIRATIDCPSCAKKVERALNRHEGIKNAVFDFERKTISLTTDLDEKEVKDICKKADEDIIFLEKEKNYELKVKIDCADCARKVEEALKRTKGIENANFNYQKGRLTVSGILPLEDIKRICKQAEEDIEFIDDEKKERKGIDQILVRILLAAMLFFVSKLLVVPYLAILAYVIAGYDVLLKALRNIIKGRVFDENFLMSIATIGALFISSYEEAAGVMIFYQIGEYFQQKAVARSRKRIGDLMDMTEEYVTVLDDGMEKVVKPEEVKINEVIKIKSGEKVALDCTILEGTSFLDKRALTGESIPVKASQGDYVMSGSINGQGILTARVQKTYQDSTASRIKDLMDSNSTKKAKSERFITRFSRYYTPAVCLIALMVAVLIPFLTGADVKTGIYRALNLLVISCPCALVLSIPLSYFAAIGSFAKNQILVKNAEGIEKLSKVETVAFDKTGTLTKGNFRVINIKAHNKNDEELLLIAASLEKESSHPVAHSILDAYKGKSFLRAEDVREIPGIGLEGTIDGIRYRIGKTGCTERLGKDDFGTVCHVEKDGICMGYIVIRDEIKEESENAIRRLKKLGVEKTVMLSGDNAASACRIGRKLHIDEIHSSLMPEQKLEELDKLIKENSPVCYVGDGMNDAPALMRADIGVAMGGVGSDAAIEAADAVIMNDDLNKLADAVEIAKRTQKIVMENIILSLGIKIAVMLFSIIGLADMWLAVFADTGVCFIAVLNAMRAMRLKKQI